MRDEGFGIGSLLFMIIGLSFTATIIFGLLSIGFSLKKKGLKIAGYTLLGVFILFII